MEPRAPLRGLTSHVITAPTAAAKFVPGGGVYAPARTSLSSISGVLEASFPQQPGQLGAH